MVYLEVGEPEVVKKGARKFKNWSFYGLLSKIGIWIAERYMAKEYNRGHKCSFKISFRWMEVLNLELRAKNFNVQAQSHYYQ